MPPQSQGPGWWAQQSFRDSNSGENYMCILKLEDLIQYFELRNNWSPSQSSSYYDLESFLQN